MGIAQRASVAALKFGVIVQRSTFGQGLFLPAFSMKSFSTAQPTFDLSSFVELRGIIVEVQWFGTTAAVEAIVCVCFHASRGLLLVCTRGRKIDKKLVKKIISVDFFFNF